MSRSGSSAIFAAQEQIGKVSTAFAAFARKEHLSFAAFTTQLIGTLETGVPQNYLLAASGSALIATYRRTNGTAYFQSFNPATGSAWALSGGTQIDGGSPAYSAMRYGLRNDSGTDKLYAPLHGASNIQLYAGAISNWAGRATYGPAFGVGFVNTSSQVQRVEAVCPTSDGSVIVAVGTHDYTTKRSTIRFWWMTPTLAVIELNTLIQMPFDTVYAAGTTHWYDVAKTAAFIHAFYDSASKTIVVIANDQVRGRAVRFTLHNGIESTLEPVVPFSAESDKLSCLASATTLINGLYYMCGRFSRTSGGVPTAWDLLMISKDGQNWSFAERSSFLTTSNLNGALALVGSTLYYGGNASAMTATPTELQLPGTPARFTLTNYVAPGVNVNASPSSSETLSMELMPDTVAGGTATFDNQPHLSAGCVIYWQSGNAVGLIDYGAYSIDKPEDAVDVSGRDSTKISATDLGSNILTKYGLPIEVDLRGRVKLATDLKTLDDLTLKTPEDRGTTASEDDHLIYDGLNEPTVMLAEADASGDAFMLASVKFSSHATGHLSSFGFVFGASEDDLTGCVVLIPKGQTTPWGNGHSHTQPSVQIFDLNPIDTSDEDKEDTGWNFKERINGLWESEIATGKRTRAATGTYRTQATYTLSPGVEYDVAFRASGRRVQVFAKARDYRPENVADSAGYVCILDFVFDAREQRSQSGKDYAGIAYSTDVYYDVAAWAHAVYDDTLISINDAADLSAYADSEAYATALDGSWEHRPSVSGDGTSDLFLSGSSEDLMRQLEIGMPLYHPASASHIVVAYFEEKIRFYNILSYLYGGTGALCIRTGQRSAWMNSGSSTTSVQNSTTRLVTDPPANKTALVLYGLGCIVNNANDAAFFRWIKSDGIQHDIYDCGGGWSNSNRGDGWVIDPQERGFDETNPVPSGRWGWNGSEPGSWRFFFSHNRICDYWMSEKGLPNDDELMCEDEVIGYRQVLVELWAWNKTVNVAYQAASQAAMLALTHTTYGVPRVGDYCNRTDLNKTYRLAALPASTLANWQELADFPATLNGHYVSPKRTYAKWTIIPTAYSIVNPQTAPSPTFSNNAVAGGDPDGDLGLIYDPVGAMVTLSGRNESGSGGFARTEETTDEDEQTAWYVKARNVGAKSVTIGMYDKAYGTLGDYMPETKSESRDVLTIEERGKWGTQKTGHSSEAPVVYHPHDASGKPPTIQVSRFALYAGRFQAVQDAVEQLCCMAGMRKARYATFHTDPTSAWQTTLTTTPQSIPLAANRANFCLDAQVHLVGNATNSSGNPTSDVRLNILFRNYYRLSLQLLNTGANYQAGRAGNVRVMLSTTNTNAGAESTPDTTDVQPSTSGDYGFLAYATIPLADFNIGGSASQVSGLQYSYTDDVTKLVNLRVAVERELITVEIDGAPVWTFNLDHFTDGTNSYRVDTAGPIQVHYSSAVSAYTATFRVLELGAELKRFTASKDSKASNNIRTISEKRFVKWIATQDGGVYFSRFWTRQAIGTLQENTWRHTWSRTDRGAPCHVLITGDEDDVAGEYFDAALAVEQGYSGYSEQNDTATTPEEAADIAKLTQIEAVEQAQQDGIDGDLRVQAQLYDTLGLAYTGSGDSPRHAASQHIVLALKATWNKNEATMSATVGKRVL